MKKLSDRFLEIDRDLQDPANYLQLRDRERLLYKQYQLRQLELMAVIEAGLGKNTYLQELYEGFKSVQMLSKVFVHLDDYAIYVPGRNSENEHLLTSKGFHFIGILDCWCFRVDLIGSPLSI